MGGQMRMTYANWQFLNHAMEGDLLPPSLYFIAEGTEVQRGC